MSPTPSNLPVETVVVVGGGLAGLTAALALAQATNGMLSPMNVHLIAPVTPSTDKRTTAFLHHSVEYMKSLGIWQSIADKAFPLKTMRIVDATNRLVRAPQADFTASEIDLEAFGYNIENRLVIEELEKQLSGHNNIVRHDCLCSEIVFGDDGRAQGVVTADGETIPCDLVVGADGRNSLVREAARIGVSNWQYDQLALVLNFSHTLPHNDTSTEFHTETGPFTLVPLGRDKSSLVWVIRPDQREAITGLDAPALEKLLEEKMQSFLGKVTVECPIQGFPLSGMTARRFGRDNVVLAGEAAHVFPPIGAQGFNLGIRDIEEIVKLVEKPVAAGTIGDQYHRARLADVTSRTASVDLLNRSLLSQFLPVQIARSLAISAIAGIPPLRHLAMRQGVEPDLSAFSPLNLVKSLLPKRPLRRTT